MLPKEPTMEKPYKCAVKYLVDLIMCAGKGEGGTLGRAIKSTQTTHTIYENLAKAGRLICSAGAPL